VTASRLLVAVVTAAVLVGGALALVNRDPAAPAPLRHVSIAPGPSQLHKQPLKVTGTTMSAQAAADAAVENGVRPDLVPLPEDAFAGPIARYRAYAAGQARAMVRAATALRRAAARGDRAAAKRAWAESFDRWLLAGAAYGALGALDTAITRSLAELERSPLSRRAAARLDSATRRLPKAVRAAELAPGDYAIRAHEILEDVQRDDLGDPSGVRATADAVAATRTVIGTLRTVLAGRGDVLQQVDSRLAELSTTLRGIRGRHGAWPAPDALPRAEREQLTGRLGAALEALAGVPGALETTLPPKIPAIR
jgi:high-affinity iron transporter